MHLAKDRGLRFPKANFKTTGEKINETAESECGKRAAQMKIIRIEEIEMSGRPRRRKRDVNVPRLLLMKQSNLIWPHQPICVP